MPHFLIYGLIKSLKKKVLFHEPVRSVLKMHVKCEYFDFCFAHLHLDFICLGDYCARGKVARRQTDG